MVKMYMENDVLRVQSLNVGWVDSVFLSVAGEAFALQPNSGFYTTLGYSRLGIGRGDRRPTADRHQENDPLGTGERYKIFMELIDVAELSEIYVWEV